MRGEIFMAVTALQRQSEDKLIRQAYQRRKDEIYFYNKEREDDRIKFEQLQAENEQAEQRAEQEQRRAEQAEAEIERLRKEIKELRSNNAKK